MRLTTDGTPSQPWFNVQDNQKSLLLKLSLQAGFQSPSDHKEIVSRSNDVQIGSFWKPILVEKEIIQERGQSFFEAGDLVIGQTISVGNRKMLIYDVDGSTRRFYAGKLERSRTVKPVDEAVHRSLVKIGFHFLKLANQNTNF